MITESFGRNEEVICRSPEGHGNSLSMELEIFRPDSIGNKWFFALNYLQTGLGYSKPSINFVYSPNGTTLRTQGQEEMVVVGKNFGPAMSPVVNVEYGPAGVGICALDCEVVTSHTHVKCMTNTGVGKNHRFIISVGYEGIALSLLQQCLIHPQQCIQYLFRIRDLILVGQPMSRKIYIFTEITSGQQLVRSLGALGCHQ